MLPSMLRLSVLCAVAVTARAAVVAQPYIWTNVKIGGGGGFVPSIVFNPGAKDHVYCR